MWVDEVRRKGRTFIFWNFTFFDFTLDLLFGCFEDWDWELLCEGLMDFGL